MLFRSAGFPSPRRTVLDPHDSQMSPDSEPYTARPVDTAQAVIPTVGTGQDWCVDWGRVERTNAGIRIDLGLTVSRHGDRRRPFPISLRGWQFLRLFGSLVSSLRTRYGHDELVAGGVGSTAVRKGREILPP